MSEESSDKGSTKNEETGQIGSEMKVTIHRVKNTTDLVMVNNEKTNEDQQEDQLKVEDDLNSLSDDDQVAQKWNSQLNDFTGESAIFSDKQGVLSGNLPNRLNIK